MSESSKFEVQKKMLREKFRKKRFAKIHKKKD